MANVIPLIIGAIGASLASGGVRRRLELEDEKRQTNRDAILKLIGSSAERGEKSFFASEEQQRIAKRLGLEDIFRGGAVIAGSSLTQQQRTAMSGALTSEILGSRLAQEQTGVQRGQVAGRFGTPFTLGPEAETETGRRVAPPITPQIRESIVGLTRPEEQALLAPRAAGAAPAGVAAQVRGQETVERVAGVEERGRERRFEAELGFKRDQLAQDFRVKIRDLERLEAEGASLQDRRRAQTEIDRASLDLQRQEVDLKERVTTDDVTKKLVEEKRRLIEAGATPREAQRIINSFAGKGELSPDLANKVLTTGMKVGDYVGVQNAALALQKEAGGIIDKTILGKKNKTLKESEVVSRLQRANELIFRAIQVKAQQGLLREEDIRKEFELTAFFRAMESKRVGKVKIDKGDIITLSLARAFGIKVSPDPALFGFGQTGIVELSPDEESILEDVTKKKER